MARQHFRRATRRSPRWIRNACLARPVLTVNEAVKHPHLNERKTVRWVEDPQLGKVAIPAVPVKFSAWPDRTELRSARLGEDNERVLRDLTNLSDEQIRKLYADGVLVRDKTLPPSSPNCLLTRSGCARALGSRSAMSRSLSPLELKKASRKCARRVGQFESQTDPLSSRDGRQRVYRLPLGLSEHRSSDIAGRPGFHAPPLAL